MKVLMYPDPANYHGPESGIKRVVEAYGKYLPNYGIEFVKDYNEYFDLLAAHAGITGKDCDVCHCHGLYWSGDYPSDKWQRRVNKNVVDSIKNAAEVTVPSEWVAETFKREMRFSPHVVPHGIDWQEWEHNYENEGYALWNKNRAGDVCSPYSMVQLAHEFMNTKFLSTFSTIDAPPNVTVLRMKSHDDMKLLVQKSGVYLSTTKETFGIGVLEAMAAGVPVLGWNTGGNAVLIEHGVNGYLANLNDMDDLKIGFDYCLKHHDVLGANGKELVKKWTWDAACEQVAAIYEKALQRESPTTAIIIPTFDYADRVGRAIGSALAQDYEMLEGVIVVDDGSTDNTREIVREWTERDNRVRYVHQENRGVACARNAGIDIASKNGTKYVCCLDADDAIEPRFLSVCVDDLEKDRSLGIAYTGLHFIKPDGSEGISPWPGEFDYDQQLQRRNQIPTCCVFRTEMWRRLGGYRQRYAPKGAGSEDADFWTRAGACGWNAKKVTDADLFVYSLGSGRVSGNKDYREADWLSWHPWAQDGGHPFASVATPGHMSHAVRQYDEPIISAVIPVGPGHVHHVWEALDSLEAQHLRKWEVIIINDTGKDDDDWEMLERAYPYAKIIKTSGKKGPGFARNRGVEIARAPLIFFLDADDWLLPNALGLHFLAWQTQGAIPYSYYLGKAYIDDISKLAPDLQNNIRDRDEETKQTIIGYRPAEFDPERAQRQPELEEGRVRPFLWCNVTTLVPKMWHNEIGGFDENMPSWEDVDYHWRMARAGHCYIRIADELLVYNFASGARRNLGHDAFQEIYDYVKEKYEGIEAMPCNCGGKRTIRPTELSAAMPNPRPKTNMKEGEVMKDEDTVMVQYLSANKGSHPFTGHATKRRYGYRAGGEIFLVLKEDLLAMPHLLRQVEGITQMVSPVIRETRRAAPPTPVSDNKPVEPTLEPRAPEAPRRISPLDADVGAHEGIDLQTVPGVTANIAAQLEADGVASLAGLIALGAEGLLQYKGVGAVKAELIVSSAQRMAAGS